MEWCNPIDSKELHCCVWNRAPFCSAEQWEGIDGCLQGARQNIRNLHSIFAPLVRGSKKVSGNKMKKHWMPYMSWRSHPALCVSVLLRTCESLELFWWKKYGCQPHQQILLIHQPSVVHASTEGQTIVLEQVGQENPFLSPWHLGK